MKGSFAGLLQLQERLKGAGENLLQDIVDHKHQEPQLVVSLLCSDWSFLLQDGKVPVHCVVTQGLVILLW